MFFSLLFTAIINIVFFSSFTSRESLPPPKTMPRLLSLEAPSTSFFSWFTSFFIRKSPRCVFENQGLKRCFPPILNSTASRSQKSVSITTRYDCWRGGGLFLNSWRTTWRRLTFFDHLFFSSWVFEHRFCSARHTIKTFHSPTEEKLCGFLSFLAASMSARGHTGLYSHPPLMSWSQNTALLYSSFYASSSSSSLSSLLPFPIFASSSSIALFSIPSSEWACVEASKWGRGSLTRLLLFAHRIRKRLGLSLHFAVII